ncbi:MAG: hypothetical protein IPP29_21975 [Bacteroidetes bacterium]|nr:hypothetical protein [Bacteroidota bacterium]
MYISLVRSNDKKKLVLNDTRRMNVAMTRAREKLVVIGDSATLANHPFYKNFIDYAEARVLMFRLGSLLHSRFFAACPTAVSGNARMNFTFFPSLRRRYG